LAVGRVVFREICDSCTLAGVVFDAHVGGVRILTNGCIGLVWGAGGILWRESPLSAQATLIIVDILTKLTNGLGWGSVPIFHESYRLDGGETAPCRHPGGTSPASCRNHAGVTRERRWNVTGTACSGSPDSRVRTGADDRQTNQGKPRCWGATMDKDGLREAIARLEGDRAAVVRLAEQAGVYAFGMVQVDACAVGTVYQERLDALDGALADLHRALLDCVLAERQEAAGASA
jgi:hypothetical protein